MTLKDQLQSDVDDVFLDLDDFAITVTYTNDSGAHQIKAIADDERNVTVDGKNVKIPTRIHINRADIASPKQQDKVTINGIDNAVETIESSAGNMYILRLRRGGRTKFN